MIEILSILADLATIFTAVCAGVLVKVSISLSSTNKATQNAKGNSNKQNITQ